MIRSGIGTPFFPLQAMLGEGPVWDQRNGCLWCVDIMECLIHRIDYRSGQHLSWTAPDKIGWIYPVAKGQFIAGLAKGICHFWPDDGRFELIQPVETALGDNRINDGTVGPDGSIWFGTMDDREEASTGRFYRFSNSILSDCGLPPICITNGPAVSPDGKLLFTVDTLAREIWVHSISRSGGIASSSIFTAVEPGHGYPDGVTCDSEGGLWVGLWGGSKARRYDPSGRITDEISFPAANITKIALGGPEGLTGFATSARKGIQVEDLRDYPLSGDIFTFDLRIAGLTPAV